MATAYAALVSIMQIIDQLQRHPRPPISDLDNQQVQSLTEIVTSLQQFLEAGYNNNAGYSDEADPLEMRIADAAHAVEDVIESHIVDRILADREDISSGDFYRAVQKVIDEMEIVKKEAMDLMKEKMRSGHELPTADADSSISAAASSSLDWPEQYTTMVGFDEILIQVLDKLTSQGSRRHVISITGMGGMGKTTLVKNVYQHPLVAEHFDFLAWVKVSQQYKIRKLLLKILEGEEQDLSLVAYEHELGHILHKKLYGRRYLIIMDDIWDIQVWDGLRVFLPDNNNGSRIIITTRLSKLAREIDDFHNMIEMDTLDEDNSWELFCKHVFGEEDCPLELQAIGKQIVEGCKGLPLSISVVGGLLAKSKQAKQYWEHIAENLHATVNLEGDKHCLQLLYISYNNLPVHLKPCFLFIGITVDNSEDCTVMAMLIALFIAEGFVKPISGKTLEETAKEYVIELVERNLILIDKTDKSMDWMYKDCTVHDLLRDLCLRESHKQNFVYVVGERSLDNIPHSIDSIRRIVVAKNTPEAEVLPLLESASHLRSLLWGESSEGVASLLSICSRLLRVAVIHNVEDVLQKVNLRFIDMRHEYRNISSMYRFWNLQTFYNSYESSHSLTAPYEIWMMSQLRFMYLMTPLSLPDPPNCETDCNIVLENLHTLANAYNFKCSEEVVKRIPRIKLLGIRYAEVEGSYDVDYCLNNLGRLQKLEILVIEVQTVNSTILVQNQNLNITFPGSLLMLNLSGTTLHWDDVTTKIGSLPLLQRLALRKDSCIGAKWETIEGHFCNLRALEIDGCGDMEYWMTENTHFPRLQELYLEGIHKLKEIPSSIGDIPTLLLIYVEDCCDSVYSSAQRIKEEQEELGNEDLLVAVVEDKYNSEEESSLEHETKNED